MAITVQVTFDCREPHALAEWWAALLGWEVEPQDAPFLRRMIDPSAHDRRGASAPDEAIDRHGQLVWAAGCAVDRVARLLEGFS